jgi:hypothetical protein
VFSIGNREYRTRREQSWARDLGWRREGERATSVEAENPGSVVVGSEGQWRRMLGIREWRQQAIGGRKRREGEREIEIRPGIEDRAGLGKRGMTGRYLLGSVS